MGFKKEDKSFRQIKNFNSDFFRNWLIHLKSKESFFTSLIYRWFPQFNFHRTSFLVLFSVLFSFLLFVDFSRSLFLKEGQIAQKNITSPFKFNVYDQRATLDKQKEAISKVLPVYDYYPHQQEELTEKINKSFLFMKSKLPNQLEKNPQQREESLHKFLVYSQEVDKILGIKLTEHEFLWLSDKMWGAYWKRLIFLLIEKWYQHKIVESFHQETDLQSSKQVVLRFMSLNNEVKEEILWPKNKLISYSYRSFFVTQDHSILKKLTREDQLVLERIAYKLLLPLVRYNKFETHERMKKASHEVSDVRYSIEKNEVIVVAGSVVTAHQEDLMNRIKSMITERRTGGITYAATLLFLLLIGIFLSFIRHSSNHKFKVKLLDLQVFSFVALLVLFCVKCTFIFLQGILIKQIDLNISSEVLVFGLPVSLASLLIALLLPHSEYVWIVTCFLAVAMGLLFPGHWPLMTLTLVGGIAAARGVLHYKKRSDLYFTGLRLGLIQMGVAVLSVILLHMNEKFGLIYDLVWALPLAFFGGIFTSFLGMIFIPIIESLFHFTTNLKLLELSDFNHPLLRDLAIKAPGTYHHCIAVGNMAEEAALQIGANSLKARVMSYYHDIGKMEHAQYFAENLSQGGENPHKSISPYLSKTIIVAHVKDGAEMARKFKLGQPILDGILQHHGTSLISYFFERAKSHAEDVKEIMETEFRYPGPKPQFKEAALVMLADSIEATARAQGEATPARLSNLVRNVIQDKFLDGQLDECDLTLKDLSVIEQSFYKVLLSIYHNRVDYPHLKFGEHKAVALQNLKNENKKNKKTKTRIRNHQSDTV